MNPISQYSLIEYSSKYRLVGAGNCQSTTGLLWQPPSYKVSGAPSAVSTERLGTTAVSYFSIHNRSGATATVTGFGGRIANRFWIAGQWDDSATGAEFLDDTTDAQDTGTGDFALETVSVNDDGFVVASRVPFNCISIDVGTASNTTTPARTITYLGADQATWTAFGTTANLFIHDGAGEHYKAAGTTDANETLIVWDVPPDWGKTPAAGVNGIPSGYYAIRVRSGTAPTGAAGLADSMAIYRLYFLTEALGDNAIMSQSFAPAEVLIGETPMEPTAGAWCDGLVMLNAGVYGTAFAGNTRATFLLRSAR